jgi:hypothetical protein
MLLPLLLLLVLLSSCPCCLLDVVDTTKSQLRLFTAFTPFFGWQRSHEQATANGHRLYRLEPRSDSRQTPLLPFSI